MCLCDSHLSVVHPFWQARKLINWARQREQQTRLGRAPTYLGYSGSQNARVLGPVTLSGGFACTRSEDSTYISRNLDGSWVVDPRNGMAGQLIADYYKKEWRDTEVGSNICSDMHATVLKKKNRAKPYRPRTHQSVQQTQLRNSR